MTLTRVLRSAVIAAMTAATFASTAQANDLSAEALWGSPPKDISFTGVKYLKESKKIVVPTVHVMMMNWGKITSVTQTSALQTLAGKANSTARSTTEVTVQVQPELVREIADALHKDLVEQLRAGGWEVLTYDEVKDKPDFANVAQEQADPEVGAVVDTVSIGKEKTRYFKVAPAGMPVIKQGFTAPMWSLRNALKEMGSNALMVTYKFEPVTLAAESKHGIAENTASTSAQANLQLEQGLANFLNPKWSGGAIMTQSARPIGENIGVVTAATDKSPKAANALSAGLGMLTGTGSINSKKSAKVVEPNVEALRERAIAGGKAFNQIVVQGLAEALN